MTKRILVLLLTFTTITVNGQNHFIGVESGVNFTNVAAKSFVDGRDFRTSLPLGITYEYIFKSGFSVGADIVYNQRGFISDFIYTDVSGIPTGQKGTFKFNYDYLTVPLKVGYNYGKIFYSFANIGLTPSILLEAKHLIPEIELPETFLSSERYNLTNKVNRFDIGGILEIGGGYKFKDRLLGFLSLSYQHSLTTFTNSDYFADSKARHYGMTVNLGIKYALTKK